MYGTLSRLYPRQGQEQAVLDHLFRWEQEYLPRVTGYVDGYIFEPAGEGLAAPGSITVILVFDSQVSYTHNRDDPEQDRWEQQLRELLEQALEWNEGEITEITGKVRDAGVAPRTVALSRRFIFLPCFFAPLLPRGLSPLRTAMSSKRNPVSKRCWIRQREAPEAKKEDVTP
jgi:hypothetical protein